MHGSLDPVGRQECGYPWGGISPVPQIQPERGRNWRPEPPDINGSGQHFSPA